MGNLIFKIALSTLSKKKKKTDKKVTDNPTIRIYRKKDYL